MLAVGSLQSLFLPLFGPLVPTEPATEYSTPLTARAGRVVLLHQKKPPNWGIPRREHGVRMAGMIEAILIAVIMVDVFALGWLAHVQVDPPPRSECCFSFPDIPDTPDQLLHLAKHHTH
jgi:hypothetical protein